MESRVQWDTGHSGTIKVLPVAASSQDSGSGRKRGERRMITTDTPEKENHLLNVDPMLYFISSRKF